MLSLYKCSNLGCLTMQKMNLPSCNFRMSEKKGKPYIFDESRTKWILLTPEEWVRQHILHFLTRDKMYPKSMIATEKKVVINGLSQRFDLLVFDRKGNPLLIAEFKSPDIAISQKTFRQASRYNEILRAPYCLVSNGMEVYLWKMDFENGKTEYLREIPDYHSLCSTV